MGGGEGVGGRGRWGQGRTLLNINGNITCNSGVALVRLECRGWDAGGRVGGWRGGGVEGGGNAQYEKKKVCFAIVSFDKEGGGRGGHGL